MKLTSFIEELGDEAAAQLFHVKVRTAASWRRQERFPRPRQAQSIIAATDGKVDMQGIYGEGEPVGAGIDSSAVVLTSSVDQSERIAP